MKKEYKSTYRRVELLFEDSVRDGGTLAYRTQKGDRIFEYRGATGGEFFLRWFDQLPPLEENEVLVKNF